MSRFFSVRGVSKSKNCDGGDSCTCDERDDPDDGQNGGQATGNGGESGDGSLESRLEALEDAVNDSDGQTSNESGGDADDTSTPQGVQNAPVTGQTTGGSAAAPGTALASMDSDASPAQSRDSAQAGADGANRLPRVPDIHTNQESGTFDGAVATDAEAQVRGMPNSWLGLMRLRNEQENAESDGDENPGANRIGKGMPAKNSVNSGSDDEQDVAAPVTVLASGDGESGDESLESRVEALEAAQSGDSPTETDDEQDGAAPMTALASGGDGESGRRR